MFYSYKYEFKHEFKFEFDSKQLRKSRYNGSHYEEKYSVCRGFNLKSKIINLKSKILNQKGLFAQGLKDVIFGNDVIVACFIFS